MKKHNNQTLKNFAISAAVAAAAALPSMGSFASSDITVDGAYSVVFGLNADGSAGAQQFDFGWDPANPQFSQNGTTLTIKPQTTTCEGNAADKDTVWGCDGSGPVAGYGKLFQDLSFFQTNEKGSVPEAETNFEGCIDASGLDSGYTVEGFVKVLSQNFADTYYTQSGTGCFSIPYTIVGDAIVQLQRGIIIKGPNGLAGADYGSATVYLGATSLPSSGSAGNTADPNAVPSVPAYGLVLLALLAGWIGQRQLRNRR